MIVPLIQFLSCFFTLPSQFLRPHSVFTFSFNFFSFTGLHKRVSWGCFQREHGWHHQTLSLCLGGCMELKWLPSICRLVWMDTSLVRLETPRQYDVLHKSHSLLSASTFQKLSFPSPTFVWIKLVYPVFSIVWQICIVGIWEITMVDAWDV